jgi:hypothetical protein
MFRCRAESDIHEKNIQMSNFTIQIIIVLLDQRFAAKRNIATAESILQVRAHGYLSG